MDKEKQIEEAPKITKIYEPIEVTDEMRKLADEMQKAVSDEYRRRVLADERALEAVLKENGWRKSSEVAEEIFEEIATILRHYDMLAERDKSEYGELIVMDIGCAIAELKKKYTEEGK